MENIEPVLLSFGTSFTQLSALLTKVAVAMLILVVGWLFALVARRLTITLLKWLKVEDFADRSGIERFLLKGGVRYTTTTIISTIVYWALIAFFIFSGLYYIGITGAAELMEGALVFIPKFILAFLALLFGLMLAKFVRAALLAWLNNLQVSGAEIIARVAHFTIAILVFFVALEYLGVGGQIVVYSFLMAFGALCLAVGISFGLAGRDHAKEILNKLLDRKL